MNIMIVAMFSTEGGISKDFVTLANSMTEIANVYCVVSKNKVPNNVSKEIDRLELKVGRKYKFGFFNIANYIKLAEFAKKNKIDCVYFYSHTPFNILATKFLKRYKLFAFLHNPIPHEGTSFIKRFVEKKTNHIMVKNCIKVFVASQFQKNDLKYSKEYSRFFDKIEVHYLGLQDSLLKEVNIKPKMDIDVLFFGRIEEYKGVDLLIDAMAELKEYNCTIIGKGKVNREIPSNVSLINEYVPDNEIVNYITNCKVGVLPYREATGTVIPLTFAYYSKPVVATNTGCLAEYVIDNCTGIIINTNDKNDLIKALKRILDDEQLRNRMGLEAKNKLNRFDNLVLAKELLNYFRISRFGFPVHMKNDS